MQIEKNPLDNTFAHSVSLQSANKEVAVGGWALCTLSLDHCCTTHARAELMDAQVSANMRNCDTFVQVQLQTTKGLSKKKNNYCGNH